MFFNLFRRKKKDPIEPIVTPKVSPSENNVIADKKDESTQFASEKSTAEQKPKVVKTVVSEPKPKAEDYKPAEIECDKNIEDTASLTKNSESNDEITKKEETKEKSRKNSYGYFEIKKTKDERFVFNLYASNHVIIATSQTYSSSQSAINGANSVIANAEKAAIEDQTLKNVETKSFPKWEIYFDKSNQYRFRLSAPNGSCICHSQGYTSKANCKNGIDSIIKTVKNATIDKSYLVK